MKYIFLDVDGVLNTEHCNTRTPNGYVFVQDDLIKNLRYIVDETGASIILSSSWRHGFYDAIRGMTNENVEDLHFLQDKLAESGLIIMGFTGEEKVSRGIQILNWIKNQEEKPEAIVILDDEAWDIHPCRRVLIQTSFHKGLTKKHAERAIKILNEVSYEELEKSVEKKTENDKSAVRHVKHGRIKG